MSPKNGTTVDLTITSAYDPMSLVSTDDKFVSTRTPICTYKPYSQPATDTFSY